MAPRLITSYRQSALSSTQSEMSAPSATVVASGIQAMTTESVTGTSPTTPLPPAPQFLSSQGIKRPRAFFGA
ncbi:hypothetical protein C1H46_004748 [Malus baccata]|uniref:Uncharacterized protein n=1 Tax=Malus baccata TaxID=106549 RepID=A0A540NF33_MALBA|nr:hypothetical protein C1H46_004748 [Malus baccata]